MRRFFDRFRIGVTHRTVHGGLGYSLGDGVDIEDIVLEFGLNPVWFEFPLYVRIESKANIYEYFWNKHYKWTQKTIEPTS